jgi:hypothetical protein
VAAASRSNCGEFEAVSTASVFAFVAVVAVPIPAPAGVVVAGDAGARVEPLASITMALESTCAAFETAGATPESVFVAACALSAPIVGVIGGAGEVAGLAASWAAREREKPPPPSDTDAVAAPTGGAMVTVMGAAMVIVTRVDPMRTPSACCARSFTSLEAMAAPIS